MKINGLKINILVRRRFRPNRRNNKATKTVNVKSSHEKITVHRVNGIEEAKKGERLKLPPYLMLTKTKQYKWCILLKANETNWDIGDIIKVKLYKKGLDLKKLELKNPLFIQGCSGIGNVGLIAVRHMLTVAKARPLFEVMNLDMPSVAFVQDGLFTDWTNIFSVTVYLWRRPKDGRDVLFSCSYTQPLTPLGSNIISNVLLKNLGDMQVKELVSLGCFGTNNYVKEPKVYVSTTSKELLSDFEKISNVVPLRDGRISGLNGIMPLMASSYDIVGVSLLAEGLARISFNPRSSKALIEVLNAQYDLNLDTGALDVYSEKLEKEIDKLKLRLPAEQMGGPEDRVGPDVDSYYT